MFISVNNLQPKENFTVQAKSGNISYKANPNNTLERNPQLDSYNKTGKTVGVVAGVLAAAAAVVLGICYHKGGAEGVEKKLGERLKDGWNELTGKAAKLRAKAEAEAKAKAEAEKEINEAYDSVIEKEQKLFEQKASEAQAKYNELYESKLSNKSAEESMKVFEDSKEEMGKIYKDLVKKDLEKGADVQECCKGLYEGKLSNKSAEESMKVFEDARIKQEANIRTVEEKALAEAEALNREVTQAMDVPSKSAEESMKVFEEAEKAARALKEKLAAQAEEMKWFDAYLQDESLRKALGIADDAEIMFSRELGEGGRPYIKNSKGNILTYDREKGFWYEWNVTAIENWGKDSYALSRTKNADGFIVTRINNQEIHTYDYIVRNLETGEEATFKDDGKIYKIFSDGRKDVEELTDIEDYKMREILNDFFREYEPTAPKRPPYGDPTELPAAFATVKDGKKQRVLNDIEAYVRSFDEGTFQRVNKNVVFYNANGEREVINIIYEGIDSDIDSLGRILPKLRVDPRISRHTETVSSRSYNHQRTAQRKTQRQKVRVKA